MKIVRYRTNPSAKNQFKDTPGPAGKWRLRNSGERLNIPGAAVLVASVLAGALVLLPMASSAPASADESACASVGDFSASVLDKAVKEVVKEMTNAAGRRALLAIYRNARQNFQRFPTGVRNPSFTPRTESTLLRKSPFLQALKHLVFIRDAIIAPTEALVAGDTGGAWAAFGNFASGAAIGSSLGLVLPAAPATAVAAAIDVYKDSVKVLRNETCLLNIDLEYYALTMSDPNMSNMAGTNRLDYFVSNYLIGGGPSPTGEDRSVHRKRAQCYLEQHLDPNLLGTTIESGRSDWYSHFVDAVSGISVRPGENAAYRSAVQSMLRNFDQLKKLEESRRTLIQFQQQPGYRAMKAATEAISPGQGRDLVGRICTIIEKQKRPQPLQNDAQDMTLLGSVWSQVEAGINGTWTRRGNSNVFDGTWDNGAIAVLEMSLDGRKITISRYDPAGVSSGFRITYKGLISADGKSASGKEHWPGGIQDWSATIR